MPGPAAKDPSVRRRRNAAVGKTLLPAGGRPGDAPAWPFTRLVQPDCWVRLWALPQAAAWESQFLVSVVGRYAVLCEMFESGEEVSAATLSEIRQLEDRLGLNAKAMRSLLWEITSDEVAEKREDKAPSKAASKRTQLKIVG